MNTCSGRPPISMVTSWPALAGSIIGEVRAVWFWKLSASLLWQIQRCCLGDGTGAHLQYLQTEKLLAETKQVARGSEAVMGGSGMATPCSRNSRPSFLECWSNLPDKNKCNLQQIGTTEDNFYTQELKSSQAISSFSRLTSCRVSPGVTLCR